MPLLSGQEQSQGKELVHARASGSRWVKYFPPAVFGVWNPLSFANPCLGGGNVNAAQSSKMSLTLDMSQGWRGVMAHGNWVPLSSWQACLLAPFDLGFQASISKTALYAWRLWRLPAGTTCRVSHRVDIQFMATFILTFVPAFLKKFSLWIHLSSQHTCLDPSLLPLEQLSLHSVHAVEPCQAE